MNDLPKTRACPRCGAESPRAGLGGLCPGCIAALAFAPGTEAAGLPSLPGHGTTHFDGHELLEELGRGGMGVVFKARQLKLNRLVAVKMILAGRLAGEVELRRFRAEAEAAAHLQHPNIVAIHEIGECDGLPYFSMDYIEGESLDAIVKAGPIGSKRAAGYVKAIAEAVQYAHERGVLHRDLKPSNVLLDKFDRPRLTDFGLAKRLTQDSDLTRTGQVLGTPNFIPPEQAGPSEGKTGPQSDVYSLGAILYFLLTARPPFAGKNLEETLSRVLGAEPVPPRRLNGELPRDLETICLKCLEKDARRRYASAQELANELERFLAERPISARPVSRAIKLWHWCRRYPVTASLAISLLVTVAALTVLLALMTGSRKPANTSSRSTEVASRLSYDYSGPVPTLMALDGATLTQTALGAGCWPAVDSKNGNCWSASLFNHSVIVRAGQSGSVVTNIFLGDCPASVTLDSNRRRVWVEAQCGRGSDLMWVINADTYAIVHGPIYCGGVNGSPSMVNTATGRFYHTVSYVPERVDPATLVQTKTAFGHVIGVNGSANLLYALGPEGSLQIIDGAPESEQILTNITLPFPVSHKWIGVNPVLNRIYVPDSTSNSIAVLDAKNGGSVGIIVLHGVAGLRGVEGIAVDPSRNTLYALEITADGSTYLFKVQDETQQVISLHTKTGAGGPVVNPAANKVYFWFTANPL